jgi:hypothetical protein
MKDMNAQNLLAQVVNWADAEEAVSNQVSILQFMADHKYDQYQRFGPGRRFIESLALWLNQFEREDRLTALSLVQRRLIFVSDEEMSHLVQLSYIDIIVQDRLRLVAEENGIASFKVGALHSHPRFKQLAFKSLYLGLSDGAHTNDLRRSSNGAISNEQIWQAYELGETKVEKMLKEMQKSLQAADVQFAGPLENQKFNLVWLVDDFSGSGNTYIRYNESKREFEGKIPKIYDRILSDGMVDHDFYEIHMLLYVSTRQAIDHIEYWSERFASERSYKPLKLHVAQPIEKQWSLSTSSENELMTVLSKSKYYDERAFDSNIATGGTDTARFGYANCSLPLVLAHNSPNNSVYALWGPEHYNFFGLFPRVSRHREI